VTSLLDLNSKVPITYLGDGLYAVLQHGQLELRANHPDLPTDIVYLEPTMIPDLLVFLKQHNFIN
jgi:hypothetical protein